MPEILLLTATSRRGLIEPTARAFSVTSPRATSTVLNPLSLAELLQL